MNDKKLLLAIATARHFVMDGLAASALLENYPKADDTVPQIHQVQKAAEDLIPRLQALLPVSDMP